eukprot:72350_1
MGCYSSQFASTIQVYTTGNGDQITILPECMHIDSEDGKSCTHDVNVKKSKEVTYTNYRMTGVEIYQWFASRDGEIPSHFVYCKDLQNLEDTPKEEIQEKVPVGEMKKKKIGRQND